MRVSASPQAAAFIKERGGRLYVWRRQHPCAGPTLETSADPPPRAEEFTAFDGGDFDLLLHPAVARLPAELAVQLKGRRRHRLVVYWDGSAVPI